MSAVDRYYLRHQPRERWWNFPWQAYRGADYPRGTMLGIAITRRGALRLVARDRRRRQREAAAREPETETELVALDEPPPAYLPERR